VRRRPAAGGLALNCFGSTPIVFDSNHRPIVESLSTNPCRRLARIHPATTQPRYGLPHRRNRLSGTTLDPPASHARTHGSRAHTTKVQHEASWRCDAGHRRRVGWAVISWWSIP